MHRHTLIPVVQPQYPLLHKGLAVIPNFLSSSPAAGSLHSETSLVSFRTRANHFSFTHNSLQLQVSPLTLHTVDQGVSVLQKRKFYTIFTSRQIFCNFYPTDPRQDKKKASRKRKTPCTHRFFLLSLKPLTHSFTFVRCAPAHTNTLDDSCLSFHSSLSLASRDARFVQISLIRYKFSATIKLKTNT